MNTDTTPDQLDPATVDGYEPPVEGETSKDRRNRKARNRRRAERFQADAEADRNPTAARPGPGRPSARGKREQAVMGILTGVGIGVMAFDEYDGVTIIEGAPDLARSLAAVADKRPAVARALDSLTEASAWAEVAAALGAIVVPIVRHHATRPEVEPEPTPTENVAGRRDTTPTPPPDADETPVFTVDPSPAVDPVPTFRVQTP